MQAYSTTIPFSEACQRNQQPILSVIKAYLKEAKQVLEIGSGTGQHAVSFAAWMKHLVWHTSDLEENHPGIKSWLKESGLKNIKPPIKLNVLYDTWPSGPYDAAFSANTAHIMPWNAVEATFAGLQNVVVIGGYYFLYGPFNYQGQFTSESNQAFDQRLRHQLPHQGIRDFEAVQVVANTNGFILSADHDMPANNRLLVWQKQV